MKKKLVFELTCDKVMFKNTLLRKPMSQLNCCLLRVAQSVVIAVYYITKVCRAFPRIQHTQKIPQSSKLFQYSNFRPHYHDWRSGLSSFPGAFVLMGPGGGVEGGRGCLEFQRTCFSQLVHPSPADQTFSIFVAFSWGLSVLIRAHYCT